MGLPRYIINFEDALEYLVPNPDNDEQELERGYQRSKGFKMDIDTNETTEMSWSPTNEIFINGLNIATKSEGTMGLDNIDMYIDDELVIKSINLMNINHYKNFRVFRKVETGQVVRFVYHNTDATRKTIWLDIDYNAEPVLCPLTVTCVNETGKEIQSETIDMSLGRHVILPPQIDGYSLISKQFFQIVELALKHIDLDIEVIFKYMKR